MTERERFDAQREAAAHATTHTGPTPERYRSALNRYITATSRREHHGAPVGSPLLDEYAWNLENNLVRDVMTRDVVSVTADTPFKQIVDVLARCRVSAVPVVDAEGKVMGVVSESDLLAKVVAAGDMRVRIHGAHAEKIERRRKAHAEAAREFMRAPAVTVRPEATVVHAARIAAIEHVRRLPVVDVTGVLVGIVTRSDLLRIFLRDDEDIRAHLMNLFAEQFRIDAMAIDITVEDGVVTLAGQVERRALIAPLLNATRVTAGVVGVHDNLTYRIDDTILPPPHGSLH